MTNEINFTPEMLEQARSAPSAAALLALAQENGITLTAEEAATYYAQLHPETGALSDEELDNVSGGCGGSDDAFSMQTTYMVNNYCNSGQAACAVRHTTNIRVQNKLKATVYKGMICNACPSFGAINDDFRSKGWPEFPRDTKKYNF